ncbi:HEPN domain-containing protein [Cupriavidus oxalaticus]|uniref:Apea-like HEPN domain-containing protein n=1 Tax=Cupriavidus oxalaticus TaxID=96344 RepID=A0A976BBP3_9BURK|nr:HEPN domain-containing protein [Cupriavidus oxalaticus]QRQ88525.1 hypothetical protein JTE91_18315 [Cupriavidus oxalaticus]QRQ93149.1 hypothetical protein JTE92_23945 [Cupriavidus oxalaticus]WQD81759.1 HEPN domain-containing protein [Cupriavidus oxalaticus]SPC13129.1 conserved hypothetical protein [Cupriavidus oxalaticus]
MAIELHPNCKARIGAILEEALADVRVTNSMFIEPTSIQNLRAADAALPANDAIRARLDAFISEDPVSDFVRETLSRELGFNQYTKDGATPLSSFQEYADIPALARRLVDEFCSLPWTYSLMVELPESLQQPAFSLPPEHRAISDQLAIYVPDENSDALYPLTTGDAQRDGRLLSKSLLSLALGVDGTQPEKWDKTKAYLQVKVSGFFGEYQSTSAAHEAISLVKAFCGLAVALRLVVLNSKWRGAETRIRSISHRNVEGRWQLHKGLELESSDSHAYQDLAFEDFNGAIATDEQKVLRLASVLSRMRAALASSYSSRLSLAAQWLFDSVAASGELLSFVQATVAIEILLGDKAVSDLMGLGELLRNRCAYLISTGQAQRDEIMKDFRLIYDVRSKIVHTGKQKLNRGEQELLQKLRWMCARVIQREIELLIADNANGQRP